MQDDEDDDEVEEVVVIGERTSSGSSTCPAGFCEHTPEPGDCGNMPCGGGGGGGGGGDGDSDDGNDEETDADAADQDTASKVDNCVRDNVSDFGAISPHTLHFDDNLTGTADLDGDRDIDRDSNGDPIQYPAEGQAKRSLLEYQTWLNIPLIRSRAAIGGHTVRLRQTYIVTHEYVHHVNPTWSEAQVTAEADDIYINTTRSACGTEDTDDDS